jgi:hypothetical protein
VDPEDLHHGNWTVSELRYPYGSLHVELLRPVGEVHQLILLGGESRTVSTCLGHALLVCSF